MEAQELIKRYNEGERDFEDVNLNGAKLNGANLNGANLNGAYLNGANLYDAYLNGANLNGAKLNGANLNGANLNGANLNGAKLEGAKLEGAKGITTASGTGEERRFAFAYRYEGLNRFQLGCFNGTYAEAIEAVTKKYDTDELRKYLKAYLLTLEAMNASLDAQYQE